MNIRYHPEALKEMVEAAIFYEEHQEGLGSRFLDIIEDAFTKIAAHPTIWLADLQGRRKYRIKRFPYLLIYTISEDAIYILAVAHTSRKPNYWRVRDSV